MLTNISFNNYNAKNEQNLLEDLMVETIKQYGFAGYYIPNVNSESRDLLFGEDPLKKFQAAYPIEMYLENTESYGGEQEFFSKFGLEIRNELSVLLARRSFSQRVPQNLYTRPLEGDLIYVPFSGASGQGELFEIRFTSGNKDFFMLGRKYPYFYELKLEKFKYSQEIVDTGIPEIDIVSEDLFNIDLVMDTNSGMGDYLYKEVVYQGTDSANATTRAIMSNWTVGLPESVLVVTNIMGTFVTNSPIIGETSGAIYNLVSYDLIEDSHYLEIYDNKIIQNEANTIIDTTETNAFGNLGFTTPSAPPGQSYGADSTTIKADSTTVTADVQ